MVAGSEVPGLHLHHRRRGRDALLISEGASRVEPASIEVQVRIRDLSRDDWEHGSFGTGFYCGYAMKKADRVWHPRPGEDVCDTSSLDLSLIHI